MTTRHYVDGSGNYIGGFGDGATPPIGSTEVQTAPLFASDTWNGTQWTSQPPAAELVDLERDRRLHAGAVVSVTGYGDVAVQGRDRDIAIYTNLALRASQKVQLLDVTPMLFRDRDNQMHSLTPTQMLEMLNLAAAEADALYAAAWALKDAVGGIPSTYKDEVNWP